MGITEELSRFAAAIRLERLPPEVVRRSRFLLLDLVGNIVRARHDAESTPALLSAAAALGMAGGTCAVFGDRARYTPAGAALLNGALGHSLDFDDTHAAASLHPGAPVIPAALAAGEMAGAGGAEVLAAIIAGYEMTCRIALALPAGEHYARGFHPTATCGAFGAAAAAGRVFGLDAAAIASALGIALSQSAGSLQFLANGAWTKRFQVGWAALSGLAAATLAFELMQTAVKPYPSCRYGHAGIDAALALRAEHGFRADEIEAVTYGLPRSGMLLVGEPAEQKANPANVVDGQFSGPFVLSVALATGAMNWDSYRLLRDPVVRGLLPKVRCAFDPEIEAEFPRYMSGKVTLRARGQEFVKKITVPKGEPANFLAEAELRQKFAGLADAVLGAERSARLADAVLAIEGASDIAGLMHLASPLPAARLAGE